jgi:GDP-L-fucose synthase
MAGHPVTDFAPGPLDRDATTYVAGHRGMVGSAVWRRLESAGFTDLRGVSSAQLDLRDRDSVFDFLAES